MDIQFLIAHLSLVQRDAAIGFDVQQTLNGLSVSTERSYQYPRCADKGDGGCGH